jgi:hypothetical protein
MIPDILQLAIIAIPLIIYALVQTSIVKNNIRDHEAKITANALAITKLEFQLNVFASKLDSISHKIDIINNKLDVMDEIKRQLKEWEQSHAKEK